MGSPELNFYRLDCLDNVELMDARGYSNNFPLHFHDQVCITLVRQGVECTETEDQQLLSPPGHFSLTPANTVHANPNINDGSYSFLTYYVSPDLLRYLAGGEEVHLQQCVIDDPILSKGLLRFPSEWTDSMKSVQFSNLLRRLIHLYANRKPTLIQANGLQRFDRAEVLSFIQTQLDQKISLQLLADRVGLGRFAFLRAFKQAVGITPGQYISIKRVEKGKELLRQGSPLVDAALSVGFYDQSHFHRHFRQLVGITPRAFQLACNIIQD